MWNKTITVTCTLLLVPCYLYLVTCTLLLVPCYLYLVTCTLLLVPCYCSLHSRHSATLLGDQLVVFGGWDFPVVYNDLSVLDMSKEYS